MPGIAFVAIAALGTAAATAAAATDAAPPMPAPTDRTWMFEARLDDKPIGTHRFVVRGPANAREVESTARFDVKFLGLTVYHYRHEAREQWQGDCLRRLDSRTDDNGKPLQVQQQRAAGDTPCIMSFAYWHPALHTQSQLLNPQTGDVEAVRFERMDDATLLVQGREARAARWKLTTPKQELVVWLAQADGRWVGLDARVPGAGQLTYRLR